MLFPLGKQNRKRDLGAIGNLILTHPPPPFDDPRMYLPIRVASSHAEQHGREGEKIRTHLERC
jgi:hypothetical protein